MKIHIGKYPGWFGPYQCAGLLKYLGFSEDTVDKIGEWLPEGPFKWLDGFKKRKIKVKIDEWDTWSMDHTLAYIIHPMLVQLKETKHGSQFIDDEDVPEELKSSSAPAKENEWDTDDNIHKRWDYILDSMIWSFAQILRDDRETQFYSGKHSIIWKKLDNDLSEMKIGPNDTFKCDSEGQKAYEEKIQFGLNMFSKYYSGLWD